MATQVPTRVTAVVSALILVVVALVIPSASAATTTVVSEGFEGSFPPSGWAQTTSAPASTFDWLRVASCANLNGNACIEAQGSADADADPEDKTYLALSQFSTSGLTSPKLEFMIHVSGDTSAFRIIKKTGPSETQYEDTIAVPSLNTGINQVSISLATNTTYDIALGFVSFDDPADIVRVDSIVVSGTTADPPPNTAPGAESVTVAGQEDLTVPVSVRGSDAESAVYYSILTQPANGTLSGTPPFMTYTPKKDWAGTDSFTFKVSDGVLDSNTATVTINVVPINDPPVITMPETAGTRQGQQITFTRLLKREVTVSDIESEAEGKPVDFYVAAAAAPATLQGDITGLTLTSGTGTADRLISGSGTIPAINAALSQILVEPPKGFTGIANLTVGIDDRGQTGLGSLGPVENHTEIKVSSGPDAYAALPDRPSKSQVGLNVFDETGEDSVLNTEVCWCRTKVTLGSQTGGLTQEDVTFKVESTGDLVNLYIYEGQDNVTKAVTAGTYQTTVFPGFYGGRAVRMEMYLARPPTTPDEEQVIKFTVTRVPGPSDPEPATSDVVLVKVKARNYKPDLLISEGYQEGGAIGNDRYEDFFVSSVTPPTGHQQHLTPKALQVGGNAASVNIWVQNDGTGPDIYDLQGDGRNNSVFDVIYYDRFSRNITSQITSGTYKTPELEPKSLGGNSDLIRMVFLARPGATPGYQERFRFRTATPGHADGDIVSVLAEVAQDIQPDLWVVSEQKFKDKYNRGVGFGTYAEHFGVASRLTEDGEIGATSIFLFTLDNTNLTKTGRFYLQGNVTQPGYSVEFFEKNWEGDPNVANGLQYVDVTTQMKTGSYQFELEPNRVKFVYAHVTVLPSVNVFGFMNELRVQARALDGLPRNQDHIIVETRAAKFQPDISGAGGPHFVNTGVGSNIYGIGNLTGPQTMSQNIGAGETVSYFFNVSSDGVRLADDVYLQGTTAPQPGYTIQWLDDKGVDITSQIAAGSYLRSLKADPGNGYPQQYVSVRAQVKAADDSAALPPQVVSLTATSSKSFKDPKPSDTFTTTTRLAYRPDLILATPTNSPTGNGVFSRTATTQTNTDNLKVGVVNQKFLNIRNAGTLPDRYLITLTSPTGMKVTIDTNTAVGNTFTTGVVQPGQLLSVPMKVKLPSDQEIDRKIDMTVDVKSVTRPGAHGDSGIFTFTPKFECVPNFSLTRGNITMNGNCVQVTDEGWLMSKDFTMNRLAFSFGSKVAFINSDTMTLTASDVTIKYAGSNVTIFDAPGRISLPLTAAGGSLNGDGTGSSVYGMTIGAGPVTFKFPSLNKAEVGLPLRPIPVFGQNAASQPFTVPALGGAPPTAPPARTTLTFPYLRLGPFNLAEVTTVFDQSTNSWLGYGRAGFPQLPIPKVPTYEIAMRAQGGTLNFAYLRLKPGVIGKVGPFSINKLEATVNLNPTNVVGSMTVNLAETPVKLPGQGSKNLPLFSVDGKFAVSGSQLSLKGSAKLLGLLTFGSFQATYQYGGVARMTANLNHSIDIGIGTLGVNSTIDGAIDVNSGRFQIQGDGDACLGIFCAGISAILSSKGAAACGRINLAIKTVGVGFGVKWNDASLKGFTGCNLDDYKDVDAPAHVDFDALSKTTEDLLTKADNVRLGIAFANAAMQSVNLPSLPSI